MVYYFLQGLYRRGANSKIFAHMLIWIDIGSDLVVEPSKGLCDVLKLLWLYCFKFPLKNNKFSWKFLGPWNIAERGKQRKRRFWNVSWLLTRRTWLYILTRICSATLAMFTGSLFLFYTVGTYWVKKQNGLKSGLHHLRAALNGEKGLNKIP